MRILMLNNEYPPLGGGQANANKYLMNEFEKYNDLEIDIITSSQDKERIEKTKTGTIYYLNIGKKKKNLHFQSSKELLIYSIKSLRKSLEIIKKKKYDLIVAWSGVPAGFISYLIHKWKNISYIVLLRGSDVPFYEERWKHLDRFIFNWLSPIVWRNARSITALSKDSRELAYKTYNKKKIEVIYNGIDTNEFKPNNNLLRKERRFSILFVGRLVERKGIIYLLKAFVNINKKYPESFLHIVGDGPLMIKLKKFTATNNISKSVKFYGAIQHKELPRIYQMSHVSVIPSLSEALGNVTHESLASGLPVITTKTGAVELIDGNGFIINKRSPEDIQRNIEKLIKNPILRKKMARESRKLSEKMSWQNVANYYYELFIKK